MSVPGMSLLGKLVNFLLAGMEKSGGFAFFGYVVLLPAQQPGPPAPDPRADCLDEPAPGHPEQLDPRPMTALEARLWHDLLH
ncbi:hypothetical protein GFY24_33855 [Nocardia sp. SYP-A9097]|uniref:DUF6059 family protein n=1 Tax=Nocardia sp. SYP-A9097 TaxID=2663237 RepID=UPI00129BE611|nr:DUF6059 family protein [Nocardia sp. SYP-A9097]MRH92360.1 hypothetical protein [Nocardia sp. SYP-A9097]